MLMDCDNCGAPMALDADRGRFHCDYCGSIRLPDESAAGIRVLPGTNPGTDCTICHRPLSRALIDGFRGLYCTQCGGVLLDQAKFRLIVDRRRARATGPADTPTQLDRDNLRREILCPECGQIMDTHPYYGPGNFVIDSCSRCNLDWLDYGELETMTNAPGRDRGSSQRTGERY
jgi:Zn-finger nucleic acid-binding protein